jgi:PTS system nitrogen regulatory IIA component
MNIEDLLDPRAVTPKVSAPTKRHALSLIADTAARRFNLDAGEIYDALMARELVGSTGVGAGVAVPHARLPNLDKMRGIFLRLENPIEFDAVDGRPVDLLFALLAPVDAGSEHLLALARVSRLLRQRELREKLREAHTTDAVYALLAHPATPSAA